jgi:hypothetical protein
MSEAMKLIVDGYIRLKDRKRLEALREDWGLMRSRLEESSKGGFEAAHRWSNSTKRFLR